jgi:L-seryl-tRNA(Ser) seleniumtransferase
MPGTQNADLRALPSVDEVLRTRLATLAAERFGRMAVVEAVRATLAAARVHRMPVGAEHAAALALARLEARESRRLKPVYNLTGTVLHTNLGRALIAEAAIEAAAAAMRDAVALEFDLDTGRRGERGR